MSIFKRLFFLIFILIGMVVMSLGIWSLFTAYQAKSWHSIDGQILEAGCKEAAEGTSARHIKYVYTVDAKRYINNREAFGGTLSDNECTADYRIEQSITVFYNPVNPSDSVLNPENYRPALFNILLGLFFTLVGLLLYFANRKKENLITPPATKKAVSNFKTSHDPAVAVTNQIFQQMPVLEGEYFIYRMPIWLGNIMRLIFTLAIIGMIWMLTKEGFNLPLPFKAFFYLFIPFFTFGVIDSRTFRIIYFLADKRGIIFPGNYKFKNPFKPKGQSKQRDWLLVPWQNISNLRTAEVGDSDGSSKAIAFDVKISPKEKDEFFASISLPEDRKKQFTSNIFSAGFSSMLLPPIETLLDLMP